MPSRIEYLAAPALAAPASLTSQASSLASPVASNHLISLSPPSASTPSTALGSPTPSGARTFSSPAASTAALFTVSAPWSPRAPTITITPPTPTKPKQAHQWRALAARLAEEIVMANNILWTRKHNAERMYRNRHNTGRQVTKMIAEECTSLHKNGNILAELGRTPRKEGPRIRALEAMIEKSRVRIQELHAKGVDYADIHDATYEAYQAETHRMKEAVRAKVIRYQEAKWVIEKEAGGGMHSS